ncbi:hypothetical protein SprV_0902770400 [Sparganum proliferum]
MAAPGRRQLMSPGPLLPPPPRTSITHPNGAIDPPSPSFTTISAPTSATTAPALSNNSLTTANANDADRTFTSHIGLAGHLRIHRPETGEPTIRPSCAPQQADAGKMTCV